MQDQYLDTFLSHSTGDGSTIKISPFIKALDSAKDKPELLSAVCILGEVDKACALQRLRDQLENPNEIIEQSPYAVASESLSSFGKIHLSLFKALENGYCFQNALPATIHKGILRRSRPGSCKQIRTGARENR